jgi:hypothetical protein
MDKFVHCIVNGAFAAMKGPLLFILLISIVVSLVRRPPGRLAPVRVRNPRRLPR